MTMLIKQPVPVTLEAWEWVFLAGWAEAAGDIDGCEELRDIFASIKRQVK
jgi:hypothetical protein